MSETADNKKPKEPSVGSDGGPNSGPKKLLKNRIRYRMEYARRVSELKRLASGENMERPPGRPRSKSVYYDDLVGLDGLDIEGEDCD